MSRDTLGLGSRCACEWGTAGGGVGAGKLPSVELKSNREIVVLRHLGEPGHKKL